MPNFDLKSLEKLLCHFYNLTSIKACLYDSDGNELCYYPTKLSSFCEILREDKLIDEKCKECDRHAFDVCKKARTQYTYTCHAGLRECISPIIYDNTIVGYIMIGQIKNSYEENLVHIQNGFTDEKKERLRSAYDNLPSIPKDKLDAAFHILDACSGYEVLKTQLLGFKNSIDSQIDTYIRKNLSSHISVPRLCSEFHLSRHEIYNICNKHFGYSPAEYIKKCRLTYACKLLATTDLPIYKVAMQCGIPDYNYFSKVFKSTYGISPTKYKNEQKNNEI